MNTVLKPLLQDVEQAVKPDSGTFYHFFIRPEYMYLIVFAKSSFLEIKSTYKEKYQELY